ncbi:hypothetical protein KJ840_02255 [Patescibacteria group bacterium]|nr:hypothetical protein [Patescibacteria group bacterium]
MNKEQSSEIDRLETKYRNLLQIALMNRILGDNSTEEQRDEWMLANAEKISGIIDGDSEKSQEIRELARQGRYDKAADLLKELINNHE